MFYKYSIYPSKYSLFGLFEIVTFQNYHYLLKMAFQRVLQIQPFTQLFRYTTNTYRPK